MLHRIVRVAAFVTIALAAVGIHAQESPTTAAALTATEQWLSLIDNRNYEASWDTSASAFRARVTREQWTGMVQGARAGFGQLKSRTLKDARTAKSLPGAPDGEYVVLQFNTSFEQKAAAVETVTVMRDTDRMWHAAGYFIK